MTTEVTIESVVHLLNEVLKSDPVAVTALFQVRVPCNEDLAAHPTVMVRAEDESYSLGMLGLLNGIVRGESDQSKKIATIVQVACPQGCDIEGSEWNIDFLCPYCKCTLENGNIEQFTILDNTKQKKKEE